MSKIASEAPILESCEKHRPEGEGGDQAALIDASERFRSLLRIVNESFGSVSKVADSAEAAISAVCSMLIADAEGCPALVIEGPPASGKTTALNFLMGQALRDSGLIVVSDSFTPAAFVSHAANRTEEHLAKNDLLPRICHKVLVVPDLAPTFGAREEDLLRNVGVLTRILDGQGYESDSGTQGHRGYHGDYRFVLMAATTPLRPAAWQILGKVGNRIVMLESGAEAVEADDLVASMMAEASYKQRVDECADAVADFLLSLWDETGGYGSVQWDQAADERALVDVIACVAQWVVRCRGSVTAERDDDDAYSMIQIEQPYRLAGGLYNLAKGRAIAAGRRQLAKEDVQFVVRIGLDSMPLECRRVVRALLRSPDGELISADVEDVLDRSRPTARRAMQALRALGAVDLDEAGLSLVIALCGSEKWLAEDAHRWALARLPS